MQSAEPITEESLPDPVALMESMRAVGYTVEAAVADLIDNSISAEATSVVIRYDASERPFLAILDNGNGMSEEELRKAMRHGSHNPEMLRSPADLGRFGLGLKTASLSQCKKLTVVTKKNAEIHARRWDLEVVRQTRQWLVVVPGIEEYAAIPMYEKLAEQSSGTLVLWECLDRLTAGATDPQREMTTRLQPLREHLALVFHRFTSKANGRPALQIRINGLEVPARDPFLHASTKNGQRLEGQEIIFESERIPVTPYVLPAISHLNREEIELAGGREGLRGSQGFYVYRNRRLVIWGTWFRLVPKNEFFKLTRVQVDIPNTLDSLWALDIKKSAAYPPEGVRKRLEELIPHFVNASRRTVTYAGRKSITGVQCSLWNRIEPRPGVFRYEVNVDHPAIVELSHKVLPEQQRVLQSALTLLGDALPHEAIYADMCSDRRSDPLPELIELARNLKSVMGFGAAQLLDMDPFVRYPQHHAQIRQALNDDQ